MKLKSLFPSLNLPEELHSRKLLLSWDSVAADLESIVLAVNSIQDDRYWDAMRHSSEQLLSVSSEVKYILNFELCIAPMNLASMQKRIGLTWEFTMRSLGKTDPQGGVVFTFGDIDLIVYCIDNNPMLSASLTEWATPFYWLLKHSDSSLDELGLRMKDRVIHACRKFFNAVEGARGISSLLDWIAVRYPNDLQGNPIIPEILSARNSNEVELDARMIYANVIASRVGEHAGLDVRKAASEALELFGPSLKGHLKLQMRALAVSVDCQTAREALSTIRQDIDEYFRGFGGDDISRYLDMTVVSDLLQPIWNLAIEENDADLLLKSARCWLNGADERSLAICLSGLPAGTAWAFPCSQTIKFSNAGDVFGKLMQQTNTVLGTQIAVSNVEGFTLNQVQEDRLGVPDDSLANDWFASLRDYYFSGISELQNDTNDAALVILRHLGHPIQAIMVAELGWTLPITFTARPPLPFNNAKRAIIFYSTELMGAEQEATCVCRVLRSANWDAEVVGDVTVYRFLREYSSADYSLIWFCGHGEVDHFQPDRKELIFKDGTLKLDDLAPPDLERQRLFVINACDSGSSHAMGGMSPLSLAGISSGEQQAVVAHLWPIGYAEATLIGAGLAAALADSEDPFEAYQEIMLKANEGPDAILRDVDLGELDCGDLLMGFSQSLSGRWNALNWASIAFFS